MNLTEAAAYLGRNVDEVRKMAAKGIIPGQKIEAEWFFYQVDLDNWAKDNPKQSYKLPREDLQALVQSRSYQQVANELGVTPSNISYHMRKMGLRRYKKN